MILKFKVNNQKLEITNKDTYLADKSNNIINAQFHINGDDWKDKQIFVLLKDNQCNTYQLHLPETNIIPIPYTVLEQEAFSISLYGEDSEETRITTNMVNFRLNRSGYTTDIKDLEDIDPDIWTQIWEGIDSKSDLGHEHIVADIRDFPKFSEVAYSGEYDDLLDKPNFSNVALTGSYNDLKNKPYIPVKTSDLTNDGEGNKPFLTTHQDISGKVDKINGKSLSTNDFTTAEKNKLANIEDKANKYVHPTTHPASMITGLSEVALSNSYNDLDNLPVIPSADNKYIFNKQGVFTIIGGSIDRQALNNSILLKIDKITSWELSPAKEIDFHDINNWNDKQDNNLVTSLDNADNTHYPSSKCVKDYIDNAIGDIEEDMRL